MMTLPTELVGIVGSALVGAIGWQISVTIKLREDVAVLRTRLDDLIRTCPNICRKEKS